MTTIRHTENEIEQYANNNQFICLQIILKDKFGNMGLISYVILEKLNNSILCIKEWVMSCRVLKRTVEEFILNYIIKLAKNNNYTIIQGEYYPTIKNVLVQDLYCEMGFTRIDQNNFKLKLGDTMYNTFIEENTLE
jgi:FkbH-like protein